MRNTIDILTRPRRWEVLEVSALSKCLVLLIACAFSGAANAYIGPGAGISFIGSLFTVLMAVFVAFAAVLVWPIRYLFRRLRKKVAAVDESAGD